MQPGDDDDRGEQHEHTQVLPTVPAEGNTDDPSAQPTFSERSDAHTQQLPSPPTPEAQPGYREEYPTQNFGQQPLYEQPGPPPAQPTQVYGQPDYTQPTYQQPGYQQPAYQPPAQPTQVFGQPDYSQPTYQQPGYPPPAYGQPTYPQPTYPQPGYQQPGYQQPAYQPPAYGQADYQQPGYQQPGYQQSGYQQAAYQQPEYAPGAATTSTKRKSRRGLWILLIVIVVIAAVIVAIFAVKPSPLFKKVLDHTSVEQTIQQQSANGSGDYTNVACPSNEKVKTGTTFQCTAAGNKRIKVTITDSSGNYVWSPVS